MKKIGSLFMLTALACLPEVFHSQVSIGAPDSEPDASAMLDVQSDEKGVLFPRLTTVQRDEIANPATGLIIYNLDCNALHLFTGTEWVPVLSAGASVLPAPGAIQGPDRVCPDETDVNFSIDPVPGATSYDWQYIGSGFSISDNEGTEAITSAFESATTGYLSVRAENECGSSPPSPYFTVTVYGPPSAPIAFASSGATLSSFIAEWSPSESATSYSIDVSSSASFSTFLPGWENYDAGDQNSVEVNGLECDSTYYYRVRANNACGSSNNSNVITGQPTRCFPGCLGFGGPDNDFGQALESDGNGGFFMAGYTNGFGNGDGSDDMYVLRLDDGASAVWAKTIGGDGYDQGISVAPSDDGGCAVAGWTGSFSAGSYDLYICKLTSSGALSWTLSIGGADFDEARSIVQTGDGGYIVAGRTQSFGEGGGDVIVAKLTSGGEVSWTKTIGGGSLEVGYDIVETADGGFAIAAETSSYGQGGADAYVIKLDSSGELVWTRTIGGASTDRVESLVELADGSIVAVGQTDSFGEGSMDVYIITLDGSGNLISTLTVGGSADERGAGVISTSDGGLAIAGRTTSFGAGGTDLYLIKLNSGGSLEWTATTGTGDEQEAMGLVELASGDIVAGANHTGGNWDFYLARFDSSGSSCCLSGNGGAESNGGNTSSGGILNTISATISSGGQVRAGGAESILCD